jgi:small-conductance mechanosensitive channel
MIVVPTPPALLAASFSDVALWARTNGLEIVFIVTGAVLLARLVGWASERVTGHIDERAAANDPLVRSEEAKHRHAVTNVVRWSVIVLLYLVATVLVIERLNVTLTSLVAPATVAGVALGFGAQRIVQDVLAGFFIITERQYGFGDVIRFSTLGATTGVTGTVEDVTLRITRLRTINGEVVIVPNGQIVQVTNLSRDWARAVVDIPIPVTMDVNRVNTILREVGDHAFADAELRPLLLDAPSVMGVESLGVDQLDIRMVARTLPGRQFDVGRALRSRIAVAFLRDGLSVPTGLTTDPATGGDRGGAPPPGATPAGAPP